MQRLPIEIMTYIANSLNLHDIFNLSLACRQFRYLVDNDDICRAALETHASYSAELQAARSSKQYARCLRQLVKLRNAIATATPYTTALVAHAVDFIYCHGTLCYTEGYEVLRLLDLHASSDLEVTIDTRKLLQSVPGANLASSKYKFRPIHFAHGVLSCLYTPRSTPRSAEGQNRLVVIDVEQRKLLTAHRLESTSKLFVRNNQEYLFYGTHSVTGDDGFKRWILRRFDTRTKQWIPGHLDLEDLAGSDIGSTVCFEIIDEFFYGLSSLASFEVYENDSMSYYYGFRIPVGSTHPRDMQLASKHSMLRRDHKDGPIDDRWSTLQLAKDLVTGNIMVSECRREWLVDEPSSVRTAYRTEVVFAAHPEDPGDGSDTEADTNQTELISTPRCSPTKLVPLKKQEDTTHVHRGDDGSTSPTITLSQCFIRSYNQSCETFIDLVNDPVAAESMSRRPQIRSISRFPRSGTGRIPNESPADSSAQVPYQTHVPNEISWWLPEVDVSRRNMHLDALDSILCPKGQSTYSNISGIMDERSMVYAMGQRGSQTRRPLVFISFDPSIKLAGLTRWPGGPKRPLCNHTTTQGDDAGPQGPYPTPQSLVSAPGSRNTSFSEGSIPDPSQSSASMHTDFDKPDAPTWIRRASAAYLQTICALGQPVGFNFAFCKDDSAPCRCC
ncbi:F-box domain-containing protein [Colletotrichum orchidophilum]|uniref:F-box domain-containing protein n=1 Tax=Colletotrichum orchidophilum TaxID=1209926 RepID=A0A1G4AXZ5_9PEZI|nr:F-box domain-containing protein [Colletotrichum orchidophilum]OHE94011.1 F-box domain-containing protein [Colletotrichum orchidophilum]